MGGPPFQQTHGVSLPELDHPFNVQDNMYTLYTFSTVSIKESNVFKWRRGKLNIKERERDFEMISMANRVENEATHQQQQQCSGKTRKRNRHVLDSLVIIIATSAVSTHR
jgi:hypothetical protein